MVGIGEVKVASRYAKSLIELAKEKNLLGPIGEDMKFFIKVCEQNPLLRKALENPIIHTDKKLLILTSIFKDKVNSFSLLLFALVLKKRREQSLISIAKEYLNIEREINGVLIAEVITTFPLTEGIRKGFIDLISKKENNSKIELIEKIDESILGGFILQIADRRIDESVLSKLNRLKNKFKDNSYTLQY